MPARYQDSMHRVQTAIATLLGISNDKRCTPKHLRVGIDMQKSDTFGLVNLLIAKGVFAGDEYLAAIAESAEIEANAYEREVQETFGSSTIKTR